MDDNEPKYGLSVMGLVHPGRILTKGGARPRDQLVLTKPLGVGIITTAAKGDVADPRHVAEAAVTMKKLNRDAARAAQAVGIHAATDITGFGLLGHGYEMAEKGDVCLRFVVHRLPFVAGAQDYAEQWLFPAGSCNNQRYYGDHISFANDVSEEMQNLLFTPETSGGLFMVVPRERMEQLAQALAASAVDYWVVGDVADGRGITVVG